MRDIQRQIISDLHVSPSIDPATEIARRSGFLADYLRHTGAAGLVLGISGGQDSCLAGRLCQLAVEEVRASGGDASFTAVRLPYHVQADEEDAQLALAFVQPDRQVTFNIHQGVKGIATAFSDAVGQPPSDFVKGNVKARVRMVAQYAIAGQSAMLVVGTDHAAEAVTGFFTKFGDGGADVLPLTGLTKRQGRALLEHLGAPAQISHKAPTADLLDEDPGQTDEANLGLSYADLDTYLEGGHVAPEVAEAIEAKYRATEHKRRVPLSMFDTWWR
ncbi:ammonia-dependent NAD(+) synthetase [Rathayibacter toxicus]|uniref:ammonia-dependent NAD(+) synthetase n=1 Tax=Rathayibacter toxicus TaxID=145458 RepID=UPI000CE8A9ED|nr:ammonia-dependent NAD(+) synthetase [Rathayibacter toxicus]PPI56730.1 NAD(+) synthase [Rathayibacter toxicus]QOD10510.1 ammonia-dependent NAD(+) synthetase [Rathayibacter toxicus]QWL27246.1 ammonia-dependent NAD(+) synthetase [Rathayibacter toxicus]